MMPGLLKRPHNLIDIASARSAADEKPDIMTEERPAKRRAGDVVNGDVQLNGDSPATNGIYANGQEVDPVVSPEKIEAVLKTVSTQLPPEIDHITQGYLPLSKLIIRLAQDTFNGLTEAINEMADMKPSQGTGQSQMNGITPSQAIQVNVQKKTRLWDFAQDRRAKFIKILVLSQWSRQAEAVSKVIDLNHWLRVQKEHYRSAVSWIGELKRLLGPMKVPKPELNTALEVLSTGKASWLPDLNYLPQNPLTPKQLLKALRTINTLLTIRLNLHESIPFHFRKYTVASGRVTFHVADEFELDLSIADEDPASQFFFIDFRFLFSPCARELPEGRLRDEIEVKTNDVLKREGLAGCYNFLHDLVLTHKIHILTSQAFELARGRWSDNLLVEKVRRSVSVQYWPNKSGGKNWIEISIVRGKTEKRLFSIGSQTPKIALRWHLGGKEVLDPDVWLDSANLSMESILKQIIALHTNYIFRETKRKLRESPIYLKKALFVKHKAHAMDPSASSLRIQLSCSDVIEMVQEPISGNFVLIPPSNLHARVERELSMLRDPAVEIVARIATLRCISAVELTEQRTRLMRWQTWRTHIPNQETIKKLFGPGIMRLLFFKVPSWEPKWLLAFTASMAGDSWWVVQMKEAKNVTAPVDAFRGPDEPFQAAFKISCTASDEGLLVNPTYSALSNIENTAAAIIAHKVDVQELEKFPVHHKQQKSTEPLGKVVVPDFYINYDPAKVPSLRKAPGTYRRWCGEIIESSFRGLSRSRTSVISIVTGRLLTNIPDIDTLTSNMGSSLAFHPTNGTFLFRLTTPVCQSSIPAILDRFQQIERLVRYLETSRRCELRCESVSLNNLTFTYATDSNANPLKSTVTFATDTPMQISFPEHDPHIRIQDFLATMLNTPKGLEHTAMILRQTLPLMRAFVSIETLERDLGSSLHILPHSATKFRVIYQNPSMAYDIHQRQRKGQTYWYLTACGSHAESGTSSLHGRAWQQICQEKGPGWHGMNGGVVSGLEAVEGLILRLDQLVREHIPDNVNEQKPEQEEGQSNAGNAIKKGPEREVITLD